MHISVCRNRFVSDLHVFIDLVVQYPMTSTNFETESDSEILNSFCCCLSLLIGVEMFINIQNTTLKTSIYPILFTFINFLINMDTLSEFLLIYFLY